METDVQKETPAPAGQSDEPAALQDEVASLVELTKKKVDRHNLTPCASCGIRVHVTVNQCPHCNSNIAATNALTRESMKRLDEIRTELDGEHQRQVGRHRSEPAKEALGARIKRFFSGSQAVRTLDSVAPAPDGPRLLDTVSEGDELKVLEYDDPWYKVKTRDGRTGWVYSTLVRDR